LRRLLLTSDDSVVLSIHAHNKSDDCGTDKMLLRTMLRVGVISPKSWLTTMRFRGALKELEPRASGWSELETRPGCPRTRPLRRVGDVCTISTAFSALGARGVLTCSAAHVRCPETFTVQANDSLGSLACDAPLPKVLRNVPFHTSLQHHTQHPHTPWITWQHSTGRCLRTWVRRACKFLQAPSHQPIPHQRSE
jgi:hypothetical protein